MEETVFHKILKKELPSYCVYEDDFTYAFLTIDPVTRGHTLVIPKNPSVNLLDIEAKDYGHVAETVRKLSKVIIKAMGADGINTVQNNNAAADQEVFYTHVHIIPRYKDQGKGKRYSYKEGDQDEIVKQIKAAL